MKERPMSNKSNRLRAKCAILLGALVAVAILTGLGTAVYAAEGDRESKILPPERISVLDPFTLDTVEVAASGSDSVRPVRMTPPIRIPVRLPLRTPYQPPGI